MRILQDQIFDSTVTAKTVLLVIASIIAVVGGQAFSAVPVTDEQITASVRQELAADGAVSAHLIEVSTLEGIVTLNGSVSHLLAEERSEDVARSIKGVRSVVNNLQVRPIVRKDTVLKGDVKSALFNDPVTEAFEVDVDVENGTAILTGTVESWAEKEIAADVAKRVKGLKNVENHINVDFETVRPDEELKAEIVRRIRNDVYVEGYDVEVNVNDGKALLTGTVDSVEEKERARRDSWVVGVSQVDASGIEVTPWTDETMQKEYEFGPQVPGQTEEAVEDALTYDPRVNSFDINVDVHNETATLTGVVDNLKAKRAAAEDAKNTVGVWEVENDIVVKTADIFRDHELEDDVKQALERDAVVERYEIGVDVRNQKASLYGTVDTFYEKEQAEDAASRVFGVVEVANNIEVDYEWDWQDDQKIRKEIEEEIFWSPFVDSDQVSVSVDDGVATLTGEVDSLVEFNSAIENAFEGGANSVKSQMEGEGVDLPEYYYPISESFWFTYVG